MGLLAQSLGAGERGQNENVWSRVNVLSLVEFSVPFMTLRITKNHQ